MVSITVSKPIQLSKDYVKTKAQPNRTTRQVTLHNYKSNVNSEDGDKV